MIKIYAASDYFGYTYPFINAGLAENTRDIYSADLVLFAGGEDISPNLYGEIPQPRTYFNPKRDEIEVKVFNYCYEKSIPMVGVCRGLQFLTVMHGGKLIQHIENHAGPSHLMIYDKGTIKVNSLHHQACLPNKKQIIIGKSFDGINESIYFPETNSFGVQWHPEMMHQDSEAVQWFLDSTFRYCNIIERSL